MCWLKCRLKRRIDRFRVLFVRISSCLASGYWRLQCTHSLHPNKYEREMEHKLQQSINIHFWWNVKIRHTWKSDASNFSSAYSTRLSLFGSMRGNLCFMLKNFWNRLRFESREMPLWLINLPVFDSISSTRLLPIIQLDESFGASWCVFRLPDSVNAMCGLLW